MSKWLPRRRRGGADVEAMDSASRLRGMLNRLTKANAAVTASAILAKGYPLGREKKETSKHEAADDSINGEDEGNDDMTKMVIQSLLHAGRSVNLVEAHSILVDSIVQGARVRGDTKAARRFLRSFKISLLQAMTNLLNERWTKPNTDSEKLQAFIRFLTVGHKRKFIGASLLKSCIEIIRDRASYFYFKGCACAPCKRLREHKSSRKAHDALPVSVWEDSVIYISSILKECGGSLLHYFADYTLPIFEELLDISNHEFRPRHLDSALLALDKKQLESKREWLDDRFNGRSCDERRISSGIRFSCKWVEDAMRPEWKKAKNPELCYIPEEDFLIKMSRTISKSLPDARELLTSLHLSIYSAKLMHRKVDTEDLLLYLSKGDQIFEALMVNDLGMKKGHAAKLKRTLRNHLDGVCRLSSHKK